MATREDLVLGIAHGFDARTLEPFVLSLRRIAAPPRCRILVGRGDRDARAFLEAQGIETEVFGSAYARLHAVARALRLPHVARRLLEHLSLRALQPLATLAGGPAARAVYARLAPLHATALRYVLFRACLEGPAGAGVRRVLLVDTRDVIFQGDPFEGAPAEGITGFLEETSCPIGRCEVNSTWLRACYGEAALAELSERGIFCSGTLLGERGAVLRYLDAMVREVARCGGRRFVSPSGFDQACHNHLLHRAPPAPLETRRNGEGAVVHLAHRAAERLAFDAEGRLLDDAGRVVPLVHQWDRHAALFAPALARIRG